MTIKEYKKNFIDLIQAIEREHGSVKSIKISSRDKGLKGVSLPKIEIVFGN